MSVKYKIRDQHGLNYMICSIVGWVDLFSRQVYRDMVLDSWRYCQEHKGFQVHAYTIMSNHLHLIASCRAPAGARLSKTNERAKYTRGSYPENNPRHIKGAREQINPEE